MTKPHQDFQETVGFYAGYELPLDDTINHYEGYQPPPNPYVGFDALIETLRELHRLEAENWKMILMVTGSVTTQTPHPD